MSLRPNSRQSSPITPARVLLGRPWPRPPVGLSFWTFFGQPSRRSTWPCHLRWRIPLPDHQAASLAGDLASWPGPWRWHRTQRVIALQAMQIRWGCGSGFSCMVHVAADSRIVNSSSGCEVEWTEGEDGQDLIELAPCGIFWWKRVHKRHLRISSPRGNRRMAPRLASPTRCDPSNCSASTGPAYPIHRLHDRMPFAGHVVSCWGHGTFLVTGVQCGIGGAASGHEAKQHIIDAHLLSATLSVTFMILSSNLVNRQFPRWRVTPLPL